MAATPSTMIDLGTKAPRFTLPDPVTGGEVSLDQVAGERGTLVMFICNHCPFVKHVRAELAKIGREYPAKGIGVVAISPNNVETHPDDSPDKMALEAKDAGYEFPYLYDETQEIAKAYSAACTPDFFLFDADRSLVYRGQLDASRPTNGVPVTGKDLRGAMDALVAGDAVAKEQTPSIGCNIKWKAGHEPAYYGT